MLRKILIALLVIVVLVVGAAVYFLTRTPDLSAYERFLTPTIIKMPMQKVIVVEATGNPEEISGTAIKLLYSLYYKIDGIPKFQSPPPAPRARWPLPANTSKMIGRFALPVPDNVTALPRFEPPDKITVKLDDWEYGEVAQILHVGPYDDEKRTVERLQSYVKDLGYAIAGAHEEEYLRGPTMFGKGNPEKYYTLIRYPVQPVAQ